MRPGNRHDDDVGGLPPLDRRVDALRYTAGGPAAARGASCLPDETIAALAEGSIDEQGRAAALPHLATCAWCRAAVASVAQALRDPELAREIAASGRPRNRRWLVIAAPIVAAATIVLLVLPGKTGIDEREHRAPASAGAPVPSGPTGRVARPLVFTWAAVAGADRYRVVLFDATGRVIYETQHTDTSVVLPDSVVLVPGRKYAWKVDARLGLNRWSASPLIEFSVGSGP